MSALLFALSLQASGLTHRWVYVAKNLQVAAEADKVCDLIVRAKKAGYNGIVLADSKLQRLDQVPDFYFTNGRKVIDAAEKNQMDIVPCVWPIGYAESELGHDVNLIEGLPVRNAPFIVRGTEARQENEGANLLPNGDLEQASNNRFQGLSFQDNPGQSTFADSSEKHAGNQSVRMQNFGGANARVVWNLKVQPFHQYLLSGWTKREGLKGYVQAIALDSKNRNLVVTEMPQDANQPWQSFKYSFNSLDNSEVKIYAGVWGGSAGKMWLDDLKVEDAGLLNVVRRPGCPLTVKGEDGTVYREGKDYGVVRDPGLGVTPWPGEYDVDHRAPSLSILPNSRIKPGQHLLVSYFHAKTGIGGQASLCPSEAATQKLMADEAQRVADLFKPKGLFWSHDEIRIGGWCDACTKRRLTPGAMLAENARQCTAIQQKILPGTTPYVWSDMFDPYHNAVDNYYLTNGTLAKSWEGLPKNAVIVNWNMGKEAESLGFFAQRGHKQILAGYYDAPVDAIKPWLAEARKTKTLDGVMYTTWVGNYADLEAFAQAAWGTQK